jgi:transcriptional regulator with XRE-family HTH domain
MDVVDRIFGILNERQEKPKHFAESIGLSSGNVSDWKSRRSKPSSDTLAKIANYFGVSMEFLLTGKESATIFNISDVQNSNGVGQVNAPLTVTPYGGLTVEELEMINIFRSLNFKRRLELLNKAVTLGDEEKAASVSGSK